MHTDEKLCPEPLKCKPDRWNIGPCKDLDKVYALFSRRLLITVLVAEMRVANKAVEKIDE